MTKKTKLTLNEVISLISKYGGAIISLLTLVGSIFYYVINMQMHIHVLEKDVVQNEEEINKVEADMDKELQKINDRFDRVLLGHPTK